MRRVRIGAIGCGVIDSKHVELAAARPDIHVVAVADVRRDVAQAVAAKYNVQRVYGAAEELLADKEVQGVVLAMPTCARFKLGLKTLVAGKHLLTEKPVAMSTAEVYRLIEARGNLIAGCCSCRLRSQPSTPPAIEALQAGKLGDPRPALPCHLGPGRENRCSLRALAPEPLAQRRRHPRELGLL